MQFLVLGVQSLQVVLLVDCSGKQSVSDGKYSRGSRSWPTYPVIVTGLGVRAQVARVVFKHVSPADRFAQLRRNLPTPVILVLVLALAQSGRVVVQVGIGVVGLALLGLVRRKKVVPEKERQFLSQSRIRGKTSSRRLTS